MHTAMPDRSHPHRRDQQDYRHPGDIVFVTFNARIGLADLAAVRVIVAKLRRMDELCGTQVSAYVVMPDHLHVVVHLTQDSGDLLKWMRYFKREVSRALRQPGMWQRSYWDRHMREEQDEETAEYYVLNNPVRRRLCDGVCDWPYSWSAYHPHTRGEPVS
jgi:putative transposase